ncbi:MAG: DUF58 domain-containing protein [Planctomycetota bacterium]
MHESDPNDDELAEVLAEVRRIQVQADRLVREVMSGGYTSVFRGSGLEFESVREYEPGDDPRAVDWNVTARVGRPYVKKYVDERELTLLFLFDVSPSMDGGFGAWSLRQTAARVCACLALAAVRNDDRIGLLTFAADALRFVPPKKGQPHALRVIRDMLVVRQGGARTGLAAGIERLMRQVRKRAIVFVVSDFLADDWQMPLRHLARRHDVTAIRLLPPEFAVPSSPVGLIDCVDPESGATRRIDFADARVRDRLTRLADDFGAEVIDSLRRAGVDRIDVGVPSTPRIEAIVTPILDYFRMRELRGEKG